MGTESPRLRRQLLPLQLHPDVEAPGASAAVEELTETETGHGQGDRSRQPLPVALEPLELGVLCPPLRKAQRTTRRAEWTPASDAGLQRTDETLYSEKVKVYFFKKFISFHCIFIPG